MVLLDQIWDDVVAGPRPDHGFGNLRKITTKDGEGGEGTSVLRSLSLPASPSAPSTPMTPMTPSPTAVRKDNVWRSVFNPGSNPATRGAGSDFYDKPQPNSPTVYDWLYSGETRSKQHH